MNTTIFETLVNFGREEILRDYSPGGCIASTRIAIDVLDYFKINAKPLSVKVEIFNEAMVKRIEAGVHGGSHEERIKWFEEDGSWGIGIGFGGQPGRWPGHLVALVENKWLLDMSLDQANRPERMIFLRPCYSEVTQEFMRAEAVHLLTLSSPEGMSLARYRYYRSRKPTEIWFEQSTT